MKLVLFDCDGTLVDSQHAIITAMTRGWRALGLGDPDPALVRRVAALAPTEMIAALLPGAEDGLIKRLAGLYRSAYYQPAPFHQSAAEPLVAGMREALAALGARGFALGVATGKSRRGLAAVLDHHGLTGAFVTLQTADHCPGKPDPEMVLRALADSGSTVADAVVIGDSPLDIEMAGRAGVPAIGVSWGYHGAAELARAGARRVVDSPAEMALAVVDLLDDRQ
ncbi:MAG: HAD-IA family hydrolase [Rhodospirillaceae bacterium]